MRENFLTVDEADVTDALDASIRRGLCTAYPHDAAFYSHTRAWHGSVPAFTVLLMDGGEAVAHVAVVDRVIDAAGRPLRVAGIENVFVRPESRGMGLAGRALAVGMGEAERRGFDAGLLFCVPGLVKLYGSLGWLPMEGVTFVRVEDGRELPLPAKNIAMWLPLRAGEFPAGVAHLRGNDW